MIITCYSCSTVHMNLFVLIPQLRYIHSSVITANLIINRQPYYNDYIITNITVYSLLTVTICSKEQTDYIFLVVLFVFLTPQKN